MIRKLTFASCYVYSPSGCGAVSRRSRLLCELLKAGDPRFIFKYAARVHEQCDSSSLLAGYIEPNDVLIPIPGSMPCSDGSISIADRLAAALVSEGIGQASWSGLRRLKRVTKSATAGAGNRPSIQAHYDSFAVDTPAESLQRVVLIDDVVSRGRTLLAAAMRVNESFPQADIRAFALLRTMGFIDGVHRLVEPCIGEIRWRAGEAYRSP